jgi:hypothetical protein
MKPNPKSMFVKILETDSLTDIALLKSTLDAEGARYFLQGENMKFIRPIEPAILMVAKEDEKKAVELLRPLNLSFSWIVFEKKHRNLGNIQATTHRRDKETDHA